MSVAVTRTWRDAQAQREGKKVPRRWLVTVIVEHRDGTRERDRTVVGEGTPHSVGTEVQAKKWGERREKELYDRGPRIEREAAAKADEPEPEKESCSKWWGDYHDAAAKGEVGRKSQGRPQAAIDDRRAIFKNWIAPAIGDMPMSDGEEMTRALRKLVRKLDDAVRVRQSFYRGEISRTPVVGQRDGKAAKPQTSGAKPGISGKTARHIWGEVTNGFKEARSSKLDELRILKGDPTVGVQPPICPDDDRDQAALYPSEIVTLLSCEAIPLSRRRVYAVAIYTGMRLSELTRFEASHVDFEHDVISVMGKKTNAATRQVPIDKALRPLLKVLAKEAPTGPLLDCPRSDGKGGSSWLMKADLERAGLKRPDLSRDDDAFMPFTFHGTRHTAITHWAVAGQPLFWLLSVAGHTDPKMTQRYLDSAAVIRSTGRFGTPHPPLPPGVLGGAKVVHLPSARSG